MVAIAQHARQIEIRFRPVWVLSKRRDERAKRASIVVALDQNLPDRILRIPGFLVPSPGFSAAAVQREGFRQLAEPVVRLREIKHRAHVAAIAFEGLLEQSSIALVL